MQPLQPLRIIDVTLAARHRTGLPSIGNDDLNAAALQHLEHRHPVDAGGLHGHGLDAQRYEPVRHPLNIAGEGLERLHRLVAQLGRHANNVEPRADVDTGSTVMDDGQTGRLDGSSRHDLLLRGERAGRGLGSDQFPKRGHTKCHHSWVRSFPWARFFDGDECLQKASGLKSSAIAA